MTGIPTWTCLRAFSYCIAAYAKLAILLLGTHWVSAAEPESVALESRITHVQPMTGIVLWSDNDRVATDAIQLEFRYCGYDECVDAQGKIDFTKIDRILDEIAARRHQAILRFYFVYPSKRTTVPEFIRKSTGYQETVANSEGKPTHFCDWSSQALKEFTLKFYSEFAAKYDRDPRIAFLQTGFGLWAEYHIYDGPWVLGKTFPDKAYQTQFLQHLDKTFHQLRWMISVDAADAEYVPIVGNQALQALRFGLFDDSFLCKQHPRVNALNWKALQVDRWQRAPAGGEFSYYNDRDQRQALSAKGPNGTSFEEAARQFHISFMIGSDQPQYQSLDRIAQAGMATGYRFRILAAQRTEGQVQLSITNTGIAPLYRDAWFANGQHRSSISLKGLLPGQKLELTLPDPDRTLTSQLSIQSDYLVSGQQIQFEASLQ